MRSAALIVTWSNTGRPLLRARRAGPIRRGRPVVTPSALHHSGGVDMAKAKPLVQAVRIRRAEHNPGPGQVRVGEDALHQPDPEARAPVRLEHEHIAEPREPGSVGDCTGKARLLAP